MLVLGAKGFHTLLMDPDQALNIIYSMAIRHCRGQATASTLSYSHFWTVSKWTLNTLIPWRPHSLQKLNSSSSNERTLTRTLPRPQVSANFRLFILVKSAAMRNFSRFLKSVKQAAPSKFLCSNFF